MKSTAITLLLGMSLTLGAAANSRAEDQTVDIPQGRGNFVALKAPQPAYVASKGVRRQAKVEAAPVATELRPVTIANPRGSIVTLRNVAR